ncbi:MAG: FG-GAP repeat domain-containing protein, partial [bacterium]
AVNYDAIPTGFGGSLFDFATGDLDLDGDLDLAVGTNTGAVFILKGNGAGGFGAPSAVTEPVFARPTSLAIADFNGNGLRDLAVVNFDSTIVTFLPGVGSGLFGARVDVNIKSRGLTPTVGDFNNDGKPDVAVAQSLSDSVAVVLNTTGG